MLVKGAHGEFLQNTIDSTLSGGWAREFLLQIKSESFMIHN